MRLYIVGLFLAFGVFGFLYIRTTRHSGLELSVDDPVVEGLGNGGYNVTNYDISFQWDQKTKTIESEVLIEAVTEKQLDRLSLDFVGFEVSQVLVNENQTEFSRKDEELILDLETEYDPDSDLKIEVFYSGTPTSTNSGVFPSGWHSLDDSAYVLGEPRGASYWFPSNDHPSDKATFDFEITTSDSQLAIANGVLVSDKKIGNGLRVAKYRMAQPMATYLTTIIIGDYEVIQADGYKDIPIRNVFPSDASLKEKLYFEDQDEMLAVYSELFGDYPFDVYGAALVDDNIGGALENQTLSVFGRQSANEYIISHELAHQWFGNSVSLTGFQDMWLNEGFATYSTYLWYEFGQGLSMEDKLAEDLRQMDLRLLDRPPGRPQLTEEGIFATHVYIRGALALHALRLEVGDDNFFEILQGYHKRFAYSNATPEGFLEVAEKQSNIELDDWYANWILEEGLPERLGSIVFDEL